jgi:hypothetical protein
MASLVLGVAGSALGGSLLGGGLFGGLLTGAQIGGALGSLAGLEIDAALTPGRTVTRTGARISDINIQASTEGTAIPRVFGRMRLAGQLIWASQFHETAVTSSTGGKGSGVTTTETDYTYAISFAVGLCAGVATRLGRVWANGALLDVSQYTMRFHRGDEDQAVDPVIADIDGDVPAFRGLCHVVFEDMPLAAFGNRIPQLQFEVWCSLGGEGALENRLTGVALIPGAGEFVYASDAVFADDGNGGSTALNIHGAVPDLDAALDDLTALAPNMAAVSLVVGWFGDDLRAGAITVRPGVEDAIKDTYPLTWCVDGVARAEAHLVSRNEDRPAYGGTPSDDSVVQAIAALKARGLAVLFNPFLFMDIAADNARPDPQTGAAGQAAYPWRGRIRALAADDQTGAAATQVAQFFGAASVSDFSVSGTQVSWSGGDDWGWRRMVLHYAHLCAAAGGVEAFLIGSELRGLTRSRSSAIDYPAVAALKALAADVRSILPDAKIGYGADWSEYSNHQTGGGGLLFNLDPLWSDTNIDFIGIDNYLPLADWRDGPDHRDAAIASSIYDPAYLASNIRGGENYDWYYASDADRAAQVRTSITDAYGKPWVWRAKDIWNWWSNLHHDRPSGGESAGATAWVPGSKPVWFTELGCPAIDKGANQPNVFFDPKSSESAAPYFSSGARDDLMQRRFLEAHLNFWRDPANNPDMVTAIYAWCWDARPFPAFPARSDVWGDTANYPVGHWLNGRLGAVALADLVAAICDDAGFSQYDVSDLDGVITGTAVSDISSARDALQPLSVACFFDAVESEGVLRFVMRGGGDALAVTADGLVLDGQATAGFQLVRAQDSDLPQVSRISYLDGDQDYRAASVEARRLTGASNRVATSSLPLVMDQGQASGIGTRLLQDAWVMRESASFTLPPSALALDAGDTVLLTAGGRAHRLRVTGIDDGAGRVLTAVATDPSLYENFPGPVRAPAMAQRLAQPGRPLLFFLDLPWILDGQRISAPFVAAYADPWPGDVAVLRSLTESNFALDATITQPCRFGVTTTDFWPGPLWRWDQVNSLSVRLVTGHLASLDDAQVLGGANALAVQNADGGWEVLQFANAELVAPNTYRLTRLLRGQAGSEGAMRAPVAAGARVMVLDRALRQLSLNPSQARQLFQYRWGPVSRPIADVSWQGAALQFSGAALLPFSPFHVRHAWQGSDLVISWLRRDRDPQAQGWDRMAAPLSEASELYDLEIWNGGVMVRGFSALTQPSQLYSAAQQAADFPSGLPNPLEVHVWQLSAALGRGHVKTELLYVV